MTCLLLAVQKYVGCIQYAVANLFVLSTYVHFGGEGTYERWYEVDRELIGNADIRDGNVIKQMKVHDPDTVPRPVRGLMITKALGYKLLEPSDPMIQSHHTRHPPPYSSPDDYCCGATSAGTVSIGHHHPTNSRYLP